MKKSIKLILLVTVIVFLFSYNSFADTCNDNAYYILNNATVSLRIITDDSQVYGCSGIIIHEDENSTGILTAQHCVEHANKIIIDDEYEVTSIQASDKIDVAYIVISDIIMHKVAVKMAKWNISVGQSVYNLGNPGWFERYTCGVVISSNQIGFISSSSAIGGCSGSGVLNIQDELVGILWGGYVAEKFGDEEPSLITHIESIRDFLKSIDYLKEEVILVK